MQFDCFPDAPLHWPRRPIEELANINPRYPLQKGRIYPFVEMAAVGENFVGITRFDEREAGASGLAKFRTNDTLFAKITPCPQNGKVAFVDRLHDEIGLGSTEFIVLSPKPGVHPRFLYHLVCAHAVRGRAAARMEGSTGRLRVPDDVFRKWLLVPVPSDTEQMAIAGVLDAVDTAIDRTRTAIVKAKRLRSGLLERLVHCGLSASGVRDWIRHIPSFPRLNPAAFPDSWRIVSLGSVATVGSGVTLGKDVSGVKYESMPYLRVANVQDGHLDLSEVKEVLVPQREIDRYLLQAGDVLMTEGGDFDKLGRGALWEGQIEPCLHQNHIFRVRPDDRQLMSRYLAYLIQSSISKRYFRRVAKQTTNLATINKTQLRRFELPLPPREEQRQIIAILETADRRVASVESRCKAIERLKKALMQDLLTGRRRLGNLVATKSALEAIDLVEASA